MVRRATFVFPAPVGAHKMILSSLVKADLNTLDYIAFKFLHPSKAFCAHVSKDDISIRFSSSFLGLGFGFKL